jgi:1-acyl-sn-glycerol-3-phosphate acyltransferase
MRSFKDGAFVLAIRTQTPMLPVVVHGTRSALRKSDWRMGDAKAEVRVLEIIETTGMTLNDVPALRDRVRDAMIAEIAKMRLAA